MSFLHKVFTRRRGDDGIAIVAAMGVVMLVGILVVVTVTIAMGESTATGRDRQRSSAIAQAESQLDVTVGRIQAAAPADLASSVCNPSTTTTKVGSDTFTVTTNVTYYSAGATPTAVSCDDVATTQLGQAVIRATATSSKLASAIPATRTMETLVQLTPNYKVNLDKAIFSQSNLTMANKTNLKSSGGTPNADIYTNGDFTCNNNEDFQGSIYAQGSVMLSSQCTIAVDVWAGNSITINNQSAAISGQALAHSGNIWLGKASLGQQARAGGSATSDSQGPCSIAGKCFSGVSVGIPPHNDFPTLVWNSQAQADWAANGYTTVVNLPNSTFPCGWYTGPDLVGADGHTTNLNGKADGVGAWLYANAYKLSGPTIVTVDPTCTTQVQLQGINVALNKNLILMSAPGINFSGNTQIYSVAGTATTANPNLLYLIQPYTFNGIAPTCNGDGISLNNQVSVDPTVNTLMYSPCSITKANQSTLTGQVYSGGQLNVNNQLDMTYQQLPVWGGLAGVTNSDTIASYNAQTKYKRETQ
ncbi:hypothetical protein CELL_02601 [Cellulomonas sp. T2.31MG-18]|uniref:hypothetical protein n=1 Tax=Cellulomonas sp. T2.31MG-18 TaxID=3157619 RepID=UPI0035E7FBA3